MDLFTLNGIPITVQHPKPSKRHADYEGFVEKFKPKKTTDDCYTPPAVYDAVLGWLRRNAPIDGRPIVRPFYPGGDYEHFEYPENCVVVDNPPFSILAKILRFYQFHGISFFLFAPYLTLFASKIDGLTYLPMDASITYENGAVVGTSFISNLFGDLCIWGAPDLCAEIKAANQRRPKQTSPKYKYPSNVITASRIGGGIVGRGVEVRIPRWSLRRISALDAQRRAGKGVFGTGFLCSDAMAAELKAKELKAKELEAKELEAKEKEIVWELSDREMKIVETLK